MNSPLAIACELTPELTPFVGDMASRLLRSVQTAPLDADRLEMIEKILAFAASAEQQLTEQQERITQLERLSLTDELTNLPNRRGFREFLRRTLAAASRHGETGIMAYVDVNDFKRINDTYGHDFGDEALRHIAQLFDQNLRLSDFAARLHGDEFVLLLTRITPAQGAIRARQIQRILNETPLVSGGLTLHLRASFGIAAYGPETEPADLLRRADRAMYEEKRVRGDIAWLNAVI
jgi:diguanylate cyclase (GGDEF)-like protein